jgi:tetratricopeptide (TPR) repeat protein
MTDTRERPVAAEPQRLRTDAEIAATFAEATDRDTPARRAVPLLCAILGVRPGRTDAVALLRGHLQALGDPEADQRAAEFAAKAEVDHPVLRRAAAAIQARRPDAALGELRPFLAERPDDPVALRLLGEAALQAGQASEGARFLRRALEIAPEYTNARRLLVDALVAATQHEAALAELDRLVAADPSIELRAVRASVLKRMRRTDEALAAYDALVGEAPENVDLRIERGNVRRNAGDGEGAAADYRWAAALRPTSGRAWLSLADMKSARLTDAELAAIEDALLDDTLGTEPRSALHFAAGSGYERAGRAREAFAHYAAANALVRMIEPYDAPATAEHVRRTVSLIEASTNPPAMQPVREGGTPIFVLGLPRSGSTLVERILAAHPEIEATEELPHLRVIAAELAGQGEYPRLLASLDSERIAGLRARYLELAAPHRRRGTSLFVDKAPANWQHLPLVVTLFPDARIVDARRDALDCGFSNYAQRFGRGHTFAYSLASIGHHARLYRMVMAAADAAWPGRVHRVEHEALVADPEGESRRLLEYVGVAWDPAVLAFHEASGPVFSASSEQVRRPINRDGIGRAEPFREWLGPLERALAG